MTFPASSTFPGSTTFPSALDTDPSAIPAFIGWGIPVGIPLVTDAYAAAVAADSPVAWYRMGEASGTTLVDSSGNARDGAYIGGVTLRAAGLVTGTDTAATLNGSTGYAQVPNGAWMAASPTAFSVEAWFRLSNVAGGYVAGQWQPTAGIGKRWMIVAGGDGNIYTTAMINGTQYNVTSPYVYNPATVYHVVMTFDGTTLRQYVNGSLVATGGAAGAMPTEALHLTIGRILGDAASFLPGVVDEVALYNSVISPARAAAHYAAGLGAAPVRIVDYVVGASSASVSTVTATLGTTPLPGDVVYCAYISHRTISRLAASVAGLGGTWAAATSASARESLWKSTDATASGTVTVTQTNVGPASLALFLVRGLAASTAVKGGTASGEPAAMPSLNAQLGQLVLAHWGTVGVNGVTAAAAPTGTPTPAGGWVPSSPVLQNNVDGASGVIWRIPVEGIPTPHAVAASVTPNGTAREIVGYVIG